ncbi:ATP-dependent RNA helicase DED1 [Penicillium brasilianum]|uniref:RNA helicase n=1 Tax=Penicillium brasilianum TaxID=104259 RepID=A0A1S9RI88_PENBI|nr:ATP-dependent RNA helicase DED1 [Penicillium brasilianum]
MDSWGEVDDALRDVTNDPDELAADSHDDNEQASDKEHKPPRNPREAGWSEPVPFHYENFTNKDSTDWASTAARYEWKDEYGDIGPRNEDLETQLFGEDYKCRVGVRFEELKKSGKEEPYSVSIESKFKLQPIATFDDGGIHPTLRANLVLCTYTWPTAIQCYTIPALYEGRDVIGIAQTGSGKTGAFLIPIVSKLMGKAKKLAAPRPNIAEGWNPKQNAVTAEPLVLIVCPTRELATQIFDDARRMCYRSMLRPCVVYGGAPAALQREELQKGCDILIGTPGRILDFMSQPRVLSLRRVRYTVIDEADELLQADWEADFKKLMAGGDLNEDSDHRYLMFSASFNKECRKLASNYLSKDHVRIRISRPGSVVRHINQRIVWIDQYRKKGALYDLLMTLQPTRTLVFVNSKRDVDIVDDYLFNQGLPTTSMHGDRLQQEREDAMRSFRTGQCPIMITTGVSARGLDIVNVMHVINYDLPSASQGGITEYMHRIGRTARIGNEGLATSFYNDDRDSGLAADLVKLLMESNQAVPDFLESFRPSEATLSFDDDSTDGEDEDVKKDETRGWAPDGGNDVSAYDELTEKEPALRLSGYITDKNDVGW